MLVTAWYRIDEFETASFAGPNESLSNSESFFELLTTLGFLDTIGRTSRLVQNHSCALHQLCVSTIVLRRYRTAKPFQGGVVALRRAIRPSDEMTAPPHRT